MANETRRTVRDAGGDDAGPQRRDLRSRRVARRPQVIRVHVAKGSGKIFAMLVKDRLVLKVPSGRVDELVEQGRGEPFDPGHGRVQKEWLSVRSKSADDWLALAIEAEAFVTR
ncbi:MAG: MmcQ/YjbR family DNA-binding protein [Candidatus Limnocylindrales bacterium]